MIAILDVAGERARQIETEGWTTAHDDQHDEGELAAAAACYALSVTRNAEEPPPPPPMWPWDAEWWKPQDRRRNLVRAGALIVAEIERLDRVALAEEERTRK